MQIRPWHRGWFEKGEAEMRLTNKVAIITGSASGIGRASAYLFASEGAKVVIADVSDADGEEAVATIKSSGGEAIFVHTDVSVASEVERLVKAARDKFGKIDILFNNAGIPMLAPLEDIEESLWDHIYAVNVKSVFLGAKYAVPEMKKVGGGVIINTASVAGVRPRLNVSAYSSSKGAVIALTRALAIELARDNIRVNSISPVWTKMTGMTEGFSEKMEERILSTIPLGRFNEPEDMAYAALYLASDESSMVTGININIDGGRGI